jgi:hypothetical protein
LFFFVFIWCAIGKGYCSGKGRKPDQGSATAPLLNTLSAALQLGEMFLICLILDQLVWLITNWSLFFRSVTDAPVDPFERHPPWVNWRTRGCTVRDHSHHIEAAHCIWTMPWTCMHLRWITCMCAHHVRRFWKPGGLNHVFATSQQWARRHGPHLRAPTANPSPRSRTGRLPRWRWLIFLPSPSFADPMLIDAPADSFRRSAIQHERIETRWWLIAILTGATSKDGSSSFLWASRRAGRSWPLPICPTRHELFHNNECATVCHRDSSLLLFY